MHTSTGYRAQAVKYAKVIVLCFYIKHLLLNLLGLNLVKIVWIRSVIRIRNNNRFFMLDLN
jgi:hypothetical protein